VKSSPHTSVQLIDSRESCVVNSIEAVAIYKSRGLIGADAFSRFLIHRIILRLLTETGSAYLRSYSFCSVELEQ
jgi:hypothetical protein